METLVHPSELSVWRRFLQARRLHKETSRSKSKDWYLPALELDCQLHLFVEDEAVTEAFLVRGRGEDQVWQKMPCPSLSGEEEEFAAYFSGLKATLDEIKIPSVGVILHLANEFATSELVPMHERPESYGELRDTLDEDPLKLLQDHTASLEDMSYRLFPNPGSESLNMLGAAITISRRYQDFLKMFRMVGEGAKFPVRTCALSAPLVALNNLPNLVGNNIPENPFCLALVYSSFSVLAFYKNGGDLVMLRTVRHHAGGIPPSVSNTIQTMAVALELGDLEVFLLPLSEKQEGVTALPGLQSSQVIRWRELEGFNGDVPLEFQASILVKPDEEEEVTGLQASKTYRELDEGRWAFQDFLPPSQEEQELYPSMMEMRALRFGTIGLQVGSVLLVLLLVWTGIRAFKIMRDTAWHVGDTKSLSNSNQILDGKIKSFEGWNGLLADRSKAWVSMELMNRLFPNPRSVALTDTKYTARPETIPNQAALGLTREWKIQGLVNDEALGHLNELNTRDGMKKIFENIFKVTGAESMRMDRDSRNLVVNLIASENKRFDPEKGGSLESQFPFQFDLTITQRITQDDPLAIPTAAVE